VFGFGVRGPLTEWTKLSVYVQFWSYVENDGRQKNLPNQVDARQGWAKLEGPWGALTAGRVRALFSRGATDIDVMYAHRWGLGFPGSIDNRGPTLGQLGFGVLGNGFSSGIIYGTPSIAGLQLDVGIFDAVQLQGMGNWTRTKYPLAQAELTFQRPFRDGWGKVVVFGNGAFQKVYKDAACTEFTDAETGNIVPCNQTIAGGRLRRASRARPGFTWAWRGTTVRAWASTTRWRSAKPRRTSRATCARSPAGTRSSRSSSRRWTCSRAGGWCRCFLTDYDQLHKQADPRDPAATVFPYNVLKRRMGINAGIVYNASPNLALRSRLLPRRGALVRGEHGQARQSVPGAEAGRVGRQRRHDRQLVAPRAGTASRHHHHSACTPMDGSTMRKPAAGRRVRVVDGAQRRHLPVERHVAEVHVEVERRAVEHHALVGAQIDLPERRQPLVLGRLTG
jgi:hypothetical protein